MARKHYRLAVEGPKNSTVVGKSYDTARQALNDVGRVNKEREAEGLKPVTVLKVSTNQGTYKHYQYVDDYDDDDE